VNNSSSPEDVGRLYDDASRMAGIFNDGHEHLAYWYGDDDETGVIEAGRRLTRKVVQALGLQAGAHVLDAGCGVGAPGIQVATETGAKVTGITISAAEAADAQLRVRAAGLTGSVCFERGDYQSMSYPAATFDAVMAIESLLHAPDLEQVLGEFSRVLRPGGRLAIAECTREVGPADDSTKIPDQFSANVLLTVPQWLAALEAAGFEVEEYTQCGRRVFSMGLRYLDHANELHDVLVDEFGAPAIAALKQGYRDMFGAGRPIGYAIIAARKPAP
jgi:cyclopropane fatty-acyl-phospholipid synthase-like methyltransferase